MRSYGKNGKFKAIKQQTKKLFAAYTQVWDFARANQLTGNRVTLLLPPPADHVLYDFDSCIYIFPF